MISQSFIAKRVSLLSYLQNAIRAMARRSRRQLTNEEWDELGDYREEQERLVRLAKTLHYDGFALL